MRSDFSAWKDRASLIEKTIREGNFKKGESAANSLIRDMTRKMTGGPDAGRLLAMPISLRALARVGLKKEPDALWDYQMAAVLWPSVESVRLGDYGPPGVRLAQLVEGAARDAAALEERASYLVPNSEPAPGPEDITPPKAIQQDAVEFPDSLRTAMKGGQAVIVMFIDEEGKPVSPRINEGSSQNAVFLFAAMEGVRDWRFQPATLQGKPIAVHYMLTVNYRLRG